tara:strand:+ start:32141 stop:33244 length:1104 start_codon:yes stop_codon:yes gene_type:complete
MSIRAALLVSLFAAHAVAQGRCAMPVTSVYQGAQASDAFSSICYLGGDRLIAGKRSSNAGNRFVLSNDHGQSWSVVGCANSTGSHTYFFGHHGNVVFCGTGDTGQACLMRSNDAGLTWSVAQSSAQLRALTGSNNVRSVFSPVHLRGNAWLVNLKITDSPNKVIKSLDGGTTWFVPLAQPGQASSSWARQMIMTGDGVLLWPQVLSARMYRSTDGGASWSFATVPTAQLFQPLCDAGNGVYLCGDATATANASIQLHRSSDMGLTWSAVNSVNLQRPGTTYWRDIVRISQTLYASACCLEGTSNQRFMQLHTSNDLGITWQSLGNPYTGPFGGMQAIYQMCATKNRMVFAACQPDSNILRWQICDWQ